MVMFFRAAPLCAAAMTAACVGGPPMVGSEPTVVWERSRQADDVEPAALTDSEARRIARAHDAAFTCEATARAMARKDSERGWLVMRHCIQRVDFADLELLLDGEWADVIAADKDAAALFAHVVAVRGGDVENDLRLLRKRKIPLYSLQAALTEPESYAGRFVLVRGEARRGHTTGSARQFSLVETKVMAESEWVSAPNSRRITTKFSGALADRPDVDVKGRGLVDENTRNQTEKVEILKNVSVETGREIVARVPSGEPGLEPGTDYIVLLKLGTVEKTEDLDGEPIEDVVAEVVDYFEPESGRFARLGR